MPGLILHLMFGRGEIGRCACEQGVFGRPLGSDDDWRYGRGAGGEVVMGGDGRGVRPLTCEQGCLDGRG